MNYSAPNHVVTSLMTEACDLRDNAARLKAYLDKGCPGASPTQAKLMGHQYLTQVDVLGIVRESLTNFGVTVLVRPISIAIATPRAKDYAFKDESSIPSDPEAN